ncbi:MAG: peptidase [Clostridiales bacterium]|uniref:peptidase n=1 Tax=Flavonifractor porci TaxID=3133422 RepID=UPI0030B13F49|nr:peptidase [Clostridiales bacterium]
MKHNRPVTALLLVAALLCSLLPPARAAGTVTIGDEAAFLDFARSCTKDTWSVGVTAELTADLDLSDADFTSIPIFQGTFHGNGHTITGLSFSGKGSKVGLFRTLTQSAQVEDLTVEGTLRPGGTGGQVGLVAGENYGTVRNCTVKGSVSGQEDVGGVVGVNGESGTVTGCSNQAVISAPSNAGGIAGQNLGTITGCTNAGEINTASDQKVPSNSGGIAGLSRGTIDHCSNSGTVGYQHLGYNAGGMAGLQSGSITNCSNTGPILGRKDVGGIVGQFEPNVEVRYGDSPADSLNDSLGVLFDEMEGFADQLSGMVDQGVEDAQAIHEAVGQIRDRAQQAGDQGLTDYRAMTDQLDRHAAALGDALDGLRGHVDTFSNEAGDDLDDLLDSTAQLRRSLSEMLDSADNALVEAVEALDDAAEGIEKQANIIRTHLQAMSRELDSLGSYLTQVADCLKKLDWKGALAVPFPSIDPAGHLSAISKALGKLPGLVSDLTGRWETLSHDTSKEMEAARKDADQAAKAIHSAASHLVGAGSALSKDSKKDLDAVSNEASAIRTLLKDYSDQLGERTQAAADDIGEQLDVIQNRVDQMTQAAGADNQALHASAQRVIGALDQVRQAIYDMGREPKLTTQDLSGDITEGPGLVMGCTAACTVEGDSNVGGIVGAVGAEVGDDPEATFDMEDIKLLSDVYATLRAAVRQCRFDGAVAVRNDCGGGIAGRCTTGSILDCAARGTVETGTDYCGGIAGRTGGSVIRCAALVDLDGGSWLGGIAGLGGTLTDCRAMVRAQGDGEYRGAIAGQSGDPLTGNRYLLEELAGLDGVDVAGQAEGLKFDAFSVLSGIPEDFLTFSYRFVADGKTVAEIPFAYGDDLDQSLVPEPPARDGEYGVWPDFPVEGLTRSMVLEARFTQPTATLSSGEEFPVLLVQGTFEPQASLRVEGLDQLPDLSGYRSVEGWSYIVQGNQGDTVTLRLRCVDAAHPVAAVQTDSGWQVVKASQDGSYLVFDGPASGQVVLLDGTAPNVMLVVLLCCAGAAVLLVIALAFHRKRKQKKIPV